MSAAAAVPGGGATAASCEFARHRVSWVLDPRDDSACVRALRDLHEPAAGRVVCHPRPGATWPALVADLLRALGKHPQALSRERCTAHGPRLLRVWLRGEQIRHLVVLRAHRLTSGLLARLVDLAADADVALWLVWHHRDTAPLPHPRVGWAAAVAALLAEPAVAARADRARGVRRSGGRRFGVRPAPGAPTDTDSGGSSRPPSTPGRAAMSERCCSA